MIEVTEIRDRIAATLGDRLGLYRFVVAGVQQTTPAIRIDDGSMPYAQEPAIEGLEIVIQPSLEVPIELTFDGFGQTFTTMVVLKQWDVQQTTLEAMPIVLGVLQSLEQVKVSKPRRVIRSAKLDNIETLSIPISQNLFTQTMLDEW